MNSVFCKIPLHIRNVLNALLVTGKQRFHWQYDNNVAMTFAESFKKFMEFDLFPFMA